MLSKPTSILIALLPFASVFLVTSCSSPEIQTNTVKDSNHESIENRCPEVSTIKIISKSLHKKLEIPGELLAFRDVPIYPKVQGFIKSMKVDRGSVVKRGQVLIEIVAPEVNAQYGETEGKLETALSSLREAASNIEKSIAQQREAEAKLASDEAVYKRIQHAAKTEGAIAETDLDEALQKVEGDRAHVQAAAQAVEAARAEVNAERGKVKAAEQALSSIREIKAYLTITAPFDGVITERNVHEGTLVSASDLSKPMLRIQQIALLRLLVPVPESAVAGMHSGIPIKFTVPAFTGKIFTATVKRVAHALDTRTRSMLVEADVINSTGELEPGMYPEVVWDMERPYPTLFAPSSAVTTSSDSTFLIRVRNGIAERVQVTRGQTMGNLVEVVGALTAGDEVVVRGTEELKTGMKVKTRMIQDAAGTDVSE